MNLFVLDQDPVAAASYHCDKHVVKMVLETAQILCTVLNQHNIQSPYRATHHNHPCTRWAGMSKDNFLWTKRLGEALGWEYARRYNKLHKSAFVIDSLEIPDTLSDKGLTQFALAMPDKYKDEDPVKAYRRYYQGEKSAIAQWKDGQLPHWWRVQDEGQGKALTQTE